MLPTWFELSSIASIPSQIASVIEEAWDSLAVFIGIHIDYAAVQKLQVRTSDVLSAD